MREDFEKTTDNLINSKLAIEIELEETKKKLEEHKLIFKERTKKIKSLEKEIKTLNKNHSAKETKLDE